MKVDVLRNEKNFAEFRIEGERHTFPNILRQKLLLRKDVELVSYILDHPTDNAARFVIRTSGKSPKKVLDEAAKEIEDDIEDFGKKAAKAFK